MEITLNIGVDAEDLDRSNGSISSVLRRAHVARASGDRGATLVEAAIYTPLLFLLLFGVLEFGLAFRSYLTVSNGTRDGSRMASVIADRSDADFQILRDVKASTAAISASSVQRIVIWRATGPDDDVPAGCAAGVANSSSTTPCNVYEATDFERSEEDFGCDATDPDRFWCPTDRKSALSDPPDYVGIWIQVRHGFVTGMFGSDLTITDQTIMRIEPQGLS
jgi:hypothetical protein